jgi:biopolymer transport protein ExbD
MRIEMPPRKPRGESIIPMINVVFLLLIFFLLTAQIAPPTPFPIEPPDSQSDIPSQQQGVLYVSAEGELAFDEARGDAVWPLIQSRDAETPVEIRADGKTPGATMAGILKKLRETTEAGAQLVVSGG